MCVNKIILNKKKFLFPNFGNRVDHGTSRRYNSDFASKHYSDQAQMNGETQHTDLGDEHEDGGRDGRSGNGPRETTKFTPQL